MTRLRLADPESSDPAAIAAIYAPWVLDSTVSFELEVPGPDEIARRIVATSQFFPWLILEDEGRILAYAYASRWRGRPAYDWICETSIYVAGDAMGTGHGRRIYGALLEILAAQGFVWAYGIISLPNPGSQAFHARMGFEHMACFSEVGFKQGRWCDLDWWRLRLNSGEAPRSPRPAHALSELQEILNRR